MLFELSTLYRTGIICEAPGLFIGYSKVINMGYCSIIDRILV